MLQEMTVFKQEDQLSFRLEGQLAQIKWFSYLIKLCDGVDGEFCFKKEFFPRDALKQ